MHAFIKRAASIVFASALALGGLAGCNAGPAEPTNAKELMERFEATENHDNFHSDTDINCEISVLGQTVPVTAKMSMDSLGDAAYGTTTGEAMGQNISSETYVEKNGDKYTTYTSSGEGADKVWTKTETDTGSLSSQIVSDKLLDGAEFAKTDAGYTLTIPGDKLLETISSSGMDLSSLVGNSGDTSIMDSFKNADVVYAFDKSCLLQTVTYAVDIEYDYNLDNTDTTASDNTASMSMSMKLDLSMKVSGYGSVDAAKVTVPEDVKKDAVDLGNLSNEVTSLLTDTDTAAEAGTATETDTATKTDAATEAPTATEKTDEAQTTANAA